MSQESTTDAGTLAVVLATKYSHLLDLMPWPTSILQATPTAILPVIANILAAPVMQSNKIQQPAELTDSALI